MARNDNINDQGEKRVEKRPLVKILKSFIIVYSSLVKILKHFIKIKFIKVKRFGKSFYVTGNLDYLFYWNKCWEPQTHKILSKLLDLNHSFIDIGAFIGPTVLYGAHFAKKVYAIEPDPIAFKELKKNVSLNPELKEKIELHEKCINSHSGKVRFGNMLKGGDSISSLQFADSKISWIVDGITFDEFIKENKIRDCNFIKVDIEGGEAIVLPSMKNYLKRNKPVLHLSMHPPFFKNAKEDTKKIIDALEIYNNIYTDEGKKIELNDLLSKKRLKRCYAIIATDKKYGAY